jgi:antirestriction protein ArdC
MSQQVIFKMVTDRMIEKLKAGTVPWRKPWVNRGMAVNWVTGKLYRGINQWLLDPGEYASFKQITAAGGKVKKGAKSEIVVFWKPMIKKNKENGEEEKFFLFRYYRVFEINTQVEGLKSKMKIESFEHDPVEEAEKIIAAYVNGPTISRNPGRAVYTPINDHVNFPPLADYPNRDEYYSTALHELIHSTGHEKRIGRPGIVNFDKFGSEQYSKEELIAEMGAAMLCGMAGIDNSTIDNSAAYIASWLEKLQNDDTLVVAAASQAQKAADLILGTTFEEKNEEEEVAA